MWQGLTGHRFHNPEISEEIADLREDTLRLVLWVTLVGYLAWHCLAIVLGSVAEEIRCWELFPIVMGGLGLTYALLQRKSSLATLCFLATSIISLTAASWFLRTDAPMLLFPFVVLVAAFLIDLLAGCLLTAATLLLLGAFSALGPLAFLTRNEFTIVGVAMLLGILTAWILERSVLIAVEWALNAYAQASQNAEAAQRHRAQLVQALRQLDNAYYRLERANAALELAWKAAESAERSKSEFVTNISHELRTPLNLIVGFSELIVTSPESYGAPLPAAYCGDLNAIYRSAQHLLSLTEDVLDLARVGMGRLTLVREPGDLAQIVKGASEIVRGYINAKGLRLRVDAPDNLPFLLIDQLRVRQILLNLLTNAARFTEKGGITITISASEGQVIVKVSDTGRGIQPTDLPRVFDPYYHVDGTQTERFEGVGLGLPLSKQLVELHGGQMGVESMVGLGTTFWFSFPTRTVEGTAPGENWRPLRLVGGPRDAAPLLVLAGVDDDVTQLLQRQLDSFQVVAVGDPREAMRVAQESRALALLVDLDWADEICASVAHVPVLSLPLPHGGRLASALGVAAYLVKPVSRVKLQATVARLGIPLHTALVVDDDPRFARLMARFLRSSAKEPRIQTLLAQNGHDALRLMDATRPDLVLLDLAMPDLDGHAVLQSMAATPRLADVPVVVISAQEGQPTLLPGPLSLTLPDGPRFEELIGVAEAILGKLDPPLRRHSRPASAPGPSDVTVSGRSLMC